jgi:NAD+ synthase (glutamine-hydrolysing)
MCSKQKVASVSPKLYVGNPTKNCNEIINILDSLKNDNIDIIAFPELCLSGATCGDLFFHDTLINACSEGIKLITKYSKNCSSHIVIGAPVKENGILYNCALHIFNGEIIEIVSKKNLSSNEIRWFSSGYEYKNKDSFFSILIGEDIYKEVSKSNLVVNICASPALVTKYEKHKAYIENYTKSKKCAYVSASAGSCESTTDYVYSGDCLHVVNGEIISEGNRFSFENEIIVSEIDIPKSVITSPVVLSKNETEKLDGNPFIPLNENDLAQRCEEILKIQSTGLAKRMTHIHCDKLVLGISGGLDSTHALLVAVETLKKLNLPTQNLICITMPGFGTTDLTYTNACNLVKQIGAELKEINVKEASLQHFKDIGHDVDVHDVTYENTQARERTQILMDYANKIGAIVVGTGDLSELALGWCTYNGDHMSMYGVNASVPKTLMKHLVKYIADKSDENIAKTLYSVLDTPISPELLPPDKNGKMEQKTETTLGPYEVHDFFIYHFIRHHKSPDELLDMAIKNFDKKYSEKELQNWLTIFIRRFFNNQFKRSCMPDGPAVGTVSLSPRGAWIMPSDAYSDEWLKF